MKNIILRFTDEELPRIFLLVAKTKQSSIQKMIKFLIEHVKTPEEVKLELDKKSSDDGISTKTD